MNICVVGLGYIGLPLAVVMARSGLRVCGIDTNRAVVDSLSTRTLHIREPGLMEAMLEAMDSGNLTFAAKPQPADAFIIAVQTPIDAGRQPDLGYVKAAAESIVACLEPGNLVVLESTVPFGTVKELLVPLLKQTKLEIGAELFVAYSPERVFPGNIMRELTTNDRIIGGIDEPSTHKAIVLYGHFVTGAIYATDATTAEMVKLMENAYRDLNIAFANELARIAETAGFNVWEAIRLANSHPRVHIHQPGPGVGGHCIPVDPWFIMDRAPQQARLMATARAINDGTPGTIESMIETIVGQVGSPVVTLLGLAFKANIDDTRGSPSIVICESLRRKGWAVKLFDPYVHLPGEHAYRDPYEAAAGADCLVLLTDHSAFQDIDFPLMKQSMRNPNILDTRNMADSERLKEIGFRFFRLGTADFKHGFGGRGDVS